MEMKKRNAILAAVIGVVIVAASAGVILTNPSLLNTANTDRDGSSDMPTGAVVATEVNSATLNRSIASPFADLAAEFNATLNDSGAPDFVTKVAVTNNMESNLTLNASGFVAMLADGNSSRAIGNLSMTVEPNSTAFPVIGFMTNGTNVQAVNYSNGSISFSVNGTFLGTDVDIPGMVLSSGPQGNTTEVRNLTFQGLAAWNISRGGYAPMPLMFNESTNGSVILALITATNLNTTDFNLTASQFWLDVGNGTWAQGDMLANNVPMQLKSNTTVPFLVGFRIADNMTTNGTIYFWPNQSQYLSQIQVDVMEIGNATPTLALKAIRQSANMTDDNGTAGGNATSESAANSTDAGNGTGSGAANATANATSNATGTRTVMMELMAIGDNVTVADVTEITVWTLRNGSMSVSPQAGGDNQSLNITVDLEQGDEVTLLSFNIGGETRYVWLRPLVEQA